MTFDIPAARQVIVERREKAAESFSMARELLEAGQITAAAAWGAASEQATKTADLLEAAIAEIADLRVSVVAFGSVHAVNHARAFGLPPGHLLPDHYDILKRAGARMKSFTRHHTTTPGRVGDGA
nr:hypothetical protein [uncultured Roseococcus sp.]